MKHTKEHLLQNQLETARACLERMCPPDQRSRRVGVAASTVRALTDYRAYLSTLEQAGDGSTGCRGLQGQLGDRAFEAESHVRILLAEGVDSLNELRDSGMLHASLRQFAEGIGSGEIDLATTAQESVKQVQQSLDLPTAFTDELLRIVKPDAITVSYDRESGTLVVRKKDDSNAPGAARIRIAPRAGDMGRIDVETFFGPSSSVTLQPVRRVGGSGDCHSRTGQARPLKSIDAYTAMLGSLAAAREAIYGHARKASRYGHGTALRARDPLTVGLVLVGVALTVFVIGVIVAAISGAPTFTLFGTAIPIGGVIAGVSYFAALVIVLWIALAFIL